MSTGETPLEMSARHVREFEERIARQKEIIFEMDRDGHEHAAVRGRQLLDTMLNLLQLAREHLAFEEGEEAKRTRTT